MIHKMHLQPQFFNFIKSGTKTIELRLYDEKRQQIHLGDTIEFTTDDLKTNNSESDGSKTFKTEVIGLLRYQTFAQLLADFDIESLADASMTKSELLATLDQFYPPEQQSQYGVLGIRLKK